MENKKNTYYSIVLVQHLQDEPEIVDSLIRLYPTEEEAHAAALQEALSVVLEDTHNNDRGFTMLHVEEYPDTCECDVAVFFDTCEVPTYEYYVMQHAIDY